MKERIFFLSGDSPALDFAAKTLTKRGLEVVDTPTSSVTHLLLDTPCRYSQDQLQQVIGGFV